jgi:hypothetical protein
VGGRGVLKRCGLLTAAALSGRSDVIRIVFSLPMLPSLVCCIGPTAVRKKVAMVPQGERVNPILHTAWLNNHALTLKSNTAKYYFGEKSSILHTFLKFCSESRKI